MRLGWLVSAGVCALFAACGGSSHKKVLVCDAAVCNPVDEAGAAGVGNGPGVTPPSEGGSGNEGGAPAESGAGPLTDAGGEAGAPIEGGTPPGSDLEITLAGNGSVSVSNAAACLSGPCQYPSNEGTVLTLQAKPGADSRFVGWSGACSGTSPTTTVTVSGLKQCVATFAVQRAVSVTVDVAGAGTVTTNPNLACGALGCSGQVDDQSSVTLNASAAAGFRFAGWAGSPECAGKTQASLAIQVSEDIACTAKFSKQFLLSVIAQGAAAPVSVTSGSCTAAMCNADAGASATFSTSPSAVSPGFRFSGWGGEALCSGVANPLPVTNIASDISCVANYTARFKVTGLVGSSLTGNVVASSGDVNASCPNNGNVCLVDSGTSTTLVAPTITGYYLSGWTGAGCTGAQSGNGLVVTPTAADVTCTATYTAGVSVSGTVVGATGAVSATSASQGSACSAGSCKVNPGSSVTLNAPNLLPTYRFVNWTGDAGCSGAALALTLANVSSSTSCSANYLQQFTIAAKASTGGTASAAANGNACAGGSCTVDAKTPVVLSATPDTANGYHFASWSGAGCTPAANNPLTLSNVNATCTANFALNTFTIGATSGANGVVTATRNDTATACTGASCSVNFGTTVTLLATPATHFHFGTWAGTGCTPATTASITLKNLTTSCGATFASDTFAASVSASPTAAATVGITCPGGNCTTVPYGQPVNVTVIANPGWSFTGWSSNCNGGTASPNSVNITGNTACVASFRPRVTGTVSPSGAGTITATGTPNAVCAAGACTVDSGGSVTLVAAASGNAIFTGWSGDCSGTSTTATATNVSVPVNCTANFYQLWAQTTGQAGEDAMSDLTVLADGTVVGVGTSTLVGTRTVRLALVDLNANTGKLARSQLFGDSKATSSVVPLGVATAPNQKNVVAFGVHRSVGVSQNPWLHNEQAPTWDYEYQYPDSGAASASGNVITTKDGSYAFAVAVNDAKLGALTGHLAKIDAMSGAPKFDTEFYLMNANGAVIPTTPVDVIEDPAGKYFAVLSQVQSANQALLLTFINEDGSLGGMTGFADDAQSVYATKLVVGAHTDSFLVTGYRVDAKDGYNGFYAELPKTTGKAAFAYSVGTVGSDEQLNSVVVTPKGYAFAGSVTDPTSGIDAAWLLMTDAAGALAGQYAYGGSDNESATSIALPAAGGFVLGGSARTWGAGLGDMWTLRLDANAAITFNAASAAQRTVTSHTRTAFALNSMAVTPASAAVTLTRVAPVVTAPAPGFTQNQQAP